jgi:hypothetical protein
MRKSVEAFCEQYNMIAIGDICKKVATVVRGGMEWVGPYACYKKTKK